VLLENCRVNKGEKKDDEALAKKMAALCDVYVNDAFGTAHRAEATTHGIARFAKVACAGPLMAAELDALGKALAQPARPLIAIVAGSKVSTKLTILGALAKKVDQLIVGGGIANTFLLAAGLPIGKSLAEAELVDEARKVMAATKVPLPVDVVVAKEFSASAPATVKAVRDVAADEMILDIGPRTAATLAARFRELIESEFRKDKSLADYASALNVSASRLRNACLSVSEQSPMQMVHARILLEAKRQLCYTSNSVSEIAYALGFDDPAYFTRFFSQRTGTSPRTFRRRAPRA